MKKLLLLSLFAALAFSGALCNAPSQALQEATKPIQLVYWRVFDDSDAFSDLIADYNAAHPNISVSYRKLNYNEYEQKLLEAMAEDRGPDIFSIHNTWMRGYQSKLLPMPPTVTLPYTTVSGTIKKDIITALKTTKTVSIRELQSQFVDQVSADAVIPDFNSETGVSTDKIYGLPLSVDTMVLYYNREILNAAGIAQPAKTWTELQEQVKKITKQDFNGNVTLSGAALGAARNIERSTDILSILMMQNGAQMLTGKGASFGEIPENLTNRSVAPGLEALIFYTDFASPQKEVYTWNETLPNSLTAFMQGRTTYFFGYAYHLPTIRAGAPKLQFGISQLPQIAGNPQVNYANYWMEVISKKTKYADAAWDFVNFITTQENNAQKYLDKTKKPTALRSLISKQMEDADLYPFASQLLTAKSWYQGKNAAGAEEALRGLISDVLTGARNPVEAMNLAEGKVNQTL
jgi:ABC-type glycerol-3-phosphate transport system substrate-binding protein